MKHYTIYVPDEGPIDAKILFVGEAPGETEHNAKRPFVGASGDLLMRCLELNGIKREEIRLSNLCHYRPVGNKFENVLGSEVLKDGLLELHTYIKEHRPSIIVALGKFPMQELTGNSAMEWRGSVVPYIYDSTLKVITTFHPSHVLRERSAYPIFDHDIKRAIENTAFSEIRRRTRTFVLDPKGIELEEWTQTLCNSESLAVDIETVKSSTQILCVGFSPSPDIAVVLDPNHARRSIERILTSNARKIFQFGTFDITQLKLNGYQVSDPQAREIERYYWWDTIVAQHVLHPEMPQGLDFLVSIYTDEPYYKKGGRGSIPTKKKPAYDKNALFTYNARDCCCTFEVYEAQLKELQKTKLWSTFNFEMGFLELAMHMSDAGLPVDEERRAFLYKAVEYKYAYKQALLEQLLKEPVNVRSPKLTELLYTKLKLPVRRNRKGKPNADEDAIVSLIAYCQSRVTTLKKPELIMEWRIKQTVCKTILEIRGLRQLLSSFLQPKFIAADGRIHSTYAALTETGRLSASKYVDSSGLNAQTLPRDPVEISDELMEKLK